MNATTFLNFFPALFVFILLRYLNSACTRSLLRLTFSQKRAVPKCRKVSLLKTYFVHLADPTQDAYDQYIYG